MPTRFTRRQFLHSGLALGAGIGLAGTSLSAQEEVPMSLELVGAIKQIHDPVIIKEDDTYYVFCTGPGISQRQSTDLINWKRGFPAIVFPNMPDWAAEMIPGQNAIWAPDISFYNGKYHLYYSVSTFGSNRSVIGLATNLTLNVKKDGYGWVDEGLVLESQLGGNYNCIDPNFVLDADGNPWLSFGSFWSGIKMRRLDLETGKPSAEDETLYSLSERFINSKSVEAPFIIRKGDFYYLFASFDFCCRGVDSTYHVMVGRSEKITGPYIDREGKEMLKGGGTQVTFPTDRWKGPGHNAILQEGDTDYIVHHAYDAENQGTPTLRIAPLTWDADGWPSISIPE